MDATEKFTGLSQLYADCRPSYPAELIDYLALRCTLTGDAGIADVGSGTGIFTRRLLARGYPVYAVEPNDEMRSTAEKSLRGTTGFHSVVGTAEHTTLEGGSVVLVTAAQAFHWFDRVAFRAECVRILRPGGLVALIWNSREAQSPIHRENAALCRRYCPNFRGFSGGIAHDMDSITQFFAGDCEERCFRNDLTLNLEGFLGRNLSASYAPRAGCGAYHPYLHALTLLFEQYCENGLLHLPNTTKCYLGQVKA